MVYGRKGKKERNPSKSVEARASEKRANGCRKREEEFPKRKKAERRAVDSSRLVSVWKPGEEACGGS